MLRKLGASSAWINRSIFHQILLYFLLPLSLAIVHSIFGLRATNQVMQQLGSQPAMRTAIPVAGILIAFYLIYMVSTYINAKRIIEK